MTVSNRILSVKNILYIFAVAHTKQLLTWWENKRGLNVKCPKLLCHGVIYLSVYSFPQLLLAVYFCTRGCFWFLFNYTQCHILGIWHVHKRKREAGYHRPLLSFHDLSQLNAQLHKYLITKQNLCHKAHFIYTKHNVFIKVATDQ